MMMRSGVVIRKMNSKGKLRLAGGRDVLTAFQKRLNLWKIRLHLTILMHRNLIIKLVMRSRSLHLHIMKYCVVRQPDLYRYIDLELILISQWNFENFDS